MNPLPPTHRPLSPLRAELFSTDQLQSHAVELASGHQIDAKRGPNRLLRRLEENEKMLLEVYDLVTSVEAENRRVAPAGEWLLDNFYLIEQHIRASRLHLPRTYSQELPRLLNSPAAGFPRVYAIALELISHADGRVDAENISHFIRSYQTITPLTLGELWAVPIMLRLGLIENLRRVSEHIAQRRRDRDLASGWAVRLQEVLAEPAHALHVLAEMAQSSPPFSNQFVEEFSARMNGQGPALATIQSWVQHRLADEGLSREQLQRTDNQTQAADQVSIGHSIGSLRNLGAMDWRQFVEAMSAVETTLHTDPAGVYPSMDFATRDAYRHRIENLARRASLTEVAVARAAVSLAALAGARDGGAARTAHVGYYLIDRGQTALEQEVRARFSWRACLCRGAGRWSVVVYAGCLAVVTLGATWALQRAGGLGGWHDWRVWLLSGLGCLSASQLAVTVVNLITTLVVPPRPLPRLDFSKGIPEESRTLVVIPTLLTNAEEIHDLLHGLELRYVGNRDPNLLFALLTDFCDALEPVHSGDGALLDAAADGIKALNERHSPGGPTLFFLFHRSRVWNPHERLWMGYERKRGKLEQLNEMLRGGSSDPFTTMVGDVASMPAIRHVITLDTDTALPRDAARRLAGTMSHPLNRPRFDPVSGRIVEGYAILQPRTPVSLTAANRSRFAQLSSGDPGLDPYTREVSDVYQDLFAEGSYVGKGIYDVDAFRQATASRFPENLILSHDLVESNYARSALVSDVELYEEHPASFTAEMSRRHRWIRGDWQIAGWLLPRVLGPGNTRIPNTLTALGWWKIFDNLRRSMVPPAMLLLLLAGWVLAPEPIGLWSCFIVALTVFPVFLTALTGLARKPQARSWGLHARTTLYSLGQQAAEAALALSSLPYRAAIHLDAIVASAGRMPFTRRGLLLWHTPRYRKRNRCQQCVDFTREMWIAPAVALAAAGWLGSTQPSELWISGPILLLWLIAPVAGWWVSRPLITEKPVLTAAQRTFLRGLSRRTWRYFEVFATETENWLAPDNFQELPGPVIASRTSPTNIGMGLLATLAAGDFGYLSASQVLDRTEKALTSLENLERYRGHLYNWYDTRSLKPLHALYVSSVDSGNLAGALATLQAGLLELKNQEVFPAAMIDGLRDTAAMLATPISTALQARLDSPPVRTPAATAAWLQAMIAEIDDLPVDGALVPEEAWWKAALAGQARAALHDVQSLAASLEQSNYMPTWQEAAAAVTASDDGPALDRLRQIDDLARRCAEQAVMDFSFLHDAGRDLLSIGYNVTDRRLDSSYYDLLASEARLASFILVARGELAQDHWFALGRQFTTHDGAMALLSWSGSMFEYLMPLVLMPLHDHTLLGETCRAVVSRQIEYGRQRGVPWGISESGYAITDAQGAYQYSAFGVPGLGFKRGLADDLVIAPYAAALALMIRPGESCQNLQRLAAGGYQGIYGLYEAIDFTPSRVPRGKPAVLLRSYMAHHQGMSLLSFASVLLDQPMQRRFLSDPYLKAAEVLLCERIPKVSSPQHLHAAEVSAARRPPEKEAVSLRVYNTPHTAAPEIQLLSNGRFHVMATNAGGGYSRWNDLAVTRWREDATCDDWGAFCYLRDSISGSLWSPAYQPTRRTANHYEAIFVQGRAEYRLRAHGMDAYTEIAVSPEHDVEVRRITLTNLSEIRRCMELTSYAEVVLAPLKADLSHPAFSNLFVQTEIQLELQAILCTRRARAPGEHPPWMFHLMTTQGSLDGPVSGETNRALFIGRHGSLEKPAAFDHLGPLSNSDGSVLDPVVALRQNVFIEPDSSANWHLITGIAATREEALRLIDLYRDPSFAARAFEMAWSQSLLELRQLQATESDSQLYAQLAGSIIYANPLHRAPAELMRRNKAGQSGLWAFGISGDLPIVLMRIGDVHRIQLVQHVLRAHAYWRQKGLEVDLVILNEDFSGYRQVLQDRIVSMMATSSESHRTDQRGGIFLRRSEDLPEEARVLLQSVARVILTDTAETLTQQVERRRPPSPAPLRFTRTLPGAAATTPVPPEHRDLVFFNGHGGFTTDGREYVIQIKPGHPTPAPWSNVLANPRLGTVISESGSAYTWIDNAHEFRLTPWANDPVRDPGGEAIYVRDEETGQFWSPTPRPAAGGGAYACRHGFGYSVFECTQHGITTELWMYVAVEAPVKFFVLKVRNRSGRARRLSVTGYWEWVLGQWRHDGLMHIITNHEAASSAIFARNDFNREFAARTAFVSVSEPVRSLTGNRTEFLGRNGTYSRPAAMTLDRLSGQTGASLDPCAAVQVLLELPNGQDREIVFLLGAGQDQEEARQLVQRFNNTASAHSALESVWSFWKKTLGAVHAETPDPALNFLVNGWLEYQTLACRYWARSGYYQSGGAYGFRDQLQDTTALLHAAPWTAREHIVRCAGRQFLMGDVQHWWHPPAGRGVRTRFSDDFLWLPYATCRYVAATGDTGVLEERAPYLEGRPVSVDEESYYDLPQISGQDGTVYEHCVRAITHGLRFGIHGLPLIGCGDWNDGMNLVGEKGKGESIWLGFFLYDVLQRFARLAESRQDTAFAHLCHQQAVKIQQNIETHGWDGDWYRRAYFDDGTPLGSATNEECQIDSIAQSWAVLSGAGRPDRARQAMASVNERLVRRDVRLVQLFDPPFNASAVEPGYIKGYIPGVRENGGQYTHGAIWAAMAMAELGQSEQAWELCSMLNPIHHSLDAAGTNRYKIEPYVIAADVYSMPPNTGRGGWSWYTGSAGWMYRLIVETLFGLHVEVDRLHLKPLLPKAWNSFKLHYRHHETFYHIVVARSGIGASQAHPLIVDGQERFEKTIFLVNDRRNHMVEMWVP